MKAEPFDPRTHAGPLPSPCTGVCQMDKASGYCRGCLRTITEIVEWGTASDARKREVWLALAGRRVA